MRRWGPGQYRAVRRTAALVVETETLRETIQEFMEDGGLVLQMSRLLADGSAEYERAVNVLRRIQTATSLERAQRMARDYLRALA